MYESKLDKWTDYLLDTGRGSNLINFKDTKSSTVEVLLPDIKQLFSKTETSFSFEVYEPKDADEDSEPTKEDAAYQGGYYGKKFGREDYLATHSKKIKKGRILLYNPYGAALPILKKIHKRAKLATEETGVNVAYMAFGFIRWKEKESDTEMRAPILLAPLQFKNDSAIDPYYIKMTEDDCIVNPTFSFRMQSEYGVRLPEYDGEGLDVYFEKVDSLISKLGWSIEKSCKIGIFSFLKLNMYHDLKDNKARILANGNVRTLLGDRPKTERVSAPKTAMALHNVVDADSSQLDAIRMAKEGRSFVIQGPPGTGKSQTITNLIAECLSDGKRVLFVSEKLAALGVVYDKLKKAGLSDFCLELHSHKANKKEFIEELCRTLRQEKSNPPKEIETVEATKERHRKQLDTYVRELHLPRGGIDMSLYQVLSLYSASAFAPDVDYAPASIHTKLSEYLIEAERLLRQYAAFTETVGRDYRKNPWYGYLSSDSSYENKLTVRKQLLSASEGLEVLVSLSEKIKNEGICESFTLSDIPLLLTVFEFLANAEIITPPLFDKKTLINVKTVILRLEKEALNIKADEKFVLESFTEEFFSLDAKETRRRLVTDFDNPIKRFFSKEYKELIKPLKAMRKTARIPKYDELVELFASSERRNEAVGVFSEYKKKISESLDEDCISLDTDWKKLSDELDGLYDLIDLAKSYFDAIIAHVCDFSAFKERLSQYAESLREARRVSGGALKSFAQGFNKNIFDYEAIPVCELNEKISGCLCNLDGFESWCRFLNLKDKLSEADLSLFITKAIDSGVEPSLIVDAYKKSYYRAWADRIIGFSLPLNEFTRISQDKSVETFSKCEEALFRLNREEIASKLSAKRPNISVISPGSPVAILTREGEKLKRQKSIRTLLSEVGELVQQIKPCFLMSPLSVSTYLSANSNIHFDVVVFDEASQIFPQDAVGAIYRANQMIVVGDSKQMPPSNFFNASSNLDESEDEDEAQDGGCYESILDLCSTSMPQLRLKWHYRSRYEQLIEFSNKNFYDGDLITFPSAITDRAWVGVDYYYVDGVFERSKRTNREEAEFIVDLIYKNIATYPERSLGVVAFSISQQELIDKLLSKRRIRRPECEFFFRPDRPEPFFIKNLETVQGDERDTVIFSVAYGKDERGVVLHNFGPLNRAGGERRLNVAVTRAKKNVQLVSSMHHTDIDLSRAKSMGAKLLKEYLEFAERKSESVRAKGDGVSEKISLENEVADFLKENGYVADRDVGCSKFKIDVAVKRDTEGDYVVAVECDGEYYRSSGGTRDRDRLRSSVLKDMGWYVYRIWSTEWYKNPAAEKKRLLLAVEEAFAEKTAHPVTPEEKDKREILDKKGYSDPKESCDSFDGHEKKELSENGFPYYEYSDPDEEAKKCPDDFPLLVRAILEKEAPLSEELLIRRMLGVLDEDKVSGVVYTEFGSLMAGCEEYGIERKNGFMYLEERDIVFREVRRGDTPRDISFISTEELSAGIKALSKAAPSMSKARIFNKLNLLCGNLTLTPLAQERLEKIYSELSKA